jgi:4-amino-4-deoxy-L-arabinose transferase-like glycosyltransferase
MDAVNPDYMAVNLLNPSGERMLPWLLPGNLLFERYPVLISFYHGSQQMWLGLPFFWLFGTSVAGIRLTHAIFALLVLASLYALLTRSKLKPWQAALACGVLAIDPGFSYAFRTQSYITLAPAAWLFFSLYALRRGALPEARWRSWLIASGVLYGLAIVGYFVYAFFLPAMLLAIYFTRRDGALPRTAWLYCTLGLALGSSFYVAGYVLLEHQFGGLKQAWAYFQQTQKALNAFSEQPDLSARIAHLVASVESVFQNSFHHTLIFGEHGTVPGAGFKMAVLLGVPVLLWARAEWRRQSPWLLRLLIAMMVSFVLAASVFGTRLSGHHFMVLLPLAYAALAIGLVALGGAPPVWRSAALTLLLPFAALAALNVGGQVKEGIALHEVRGAGLYSDAINRLAADLDAAPARPFVYFPDWGLLMPVVMLTGGRVGVDSLENFDAARKRLCAGRDVAVALVTGDRDARFANWQKALAWDSPERTAYREARGAIVFELATFRGRRNASGCVTP